MLIVIRTKKAFIVLSTHSWCVSDISSSIRWQSALINDKVQLNFALISSLSVYGFKLVHWAAINQTPLNVWFVGNHLYVLGFQPCSGELNWDHDHSRREEFGCYSSQIWIKMDVSWLYVIFLFLWTGLCILVLCLDHDVWTDVESHSRTSLRT